MQPERTLITHTRALPLLAQTFPLFSQKHQSTKHVLPSIFLSSHSHACSLSPVTKPSSFSPCGFALPGMLSPQNFSLGQLWHLIHIPAKTSAFPEELATLTSVSSSFSFSSYLHFVFYHVFFPFVCFVLILTLYSLYY